MGEDGHQGLNAIKQGKGGETTRKQRQRRTYKF